MVRGGGLADGRTGGQTDRRGTISARASQHTGHPERSEGSLRLTSDSGTQPASSHCELPPRLRSELAPSFARGQAPAAWQSRRLPAVIPYCFSGFVDQPAADYPQVFGATHLHQKALLELASRSRCLVSSLHQAGTPGQNDYQPSTPRSGGSGRARPPHLLRSKQSHRLQRRRQNALECQLETMVCSRRSLGAGGGERWR